MEPSNKVGQSHSAKTSIQRGAESLLWGLATAGITFAVVRRFMKLEGWRQYCAVGAGGAVGALASSVLLSGAAVEMDRDKELLAQLSQGWFDQFNAGEELSQADKSILAQIQKFCPQWFNGLDKDKIVPLIKLLPNLKVLSFQRWTEDGYQGSAKLFSDLDGLVQELFSGASQRAPLQVFVPNGSLLRKMGEWLNKQRLSAAEKNCLSSVTGFALIGPRFDERGSEEALTLLLPHLKKLQWLNLSHTNPRLFTCSFIHSLQQIETLKEIALPSVMTNSMITRIDNDGEFSEDEKAYLSICSEAKIKCNFITDKLTIDSNCVRHPFKTALKFLESTPRLRSLDLSVDNAIWDEETGREFLRVLQTRPQLRFRWRDASVCQGEGVAVEIAEKDAYCCIGSSFPISPSLRANPSVKTVVCSRPREGELQTLAPLLRNKKILLNYEPKAKEGGSSALKIVLEKLSPSLLEIALDYGKTMDREDLEMLKNGGYEFRAQNTLSEEICSLAESGIEEWENLSWEAWKSQQFVQTRRTSITGASFDLVFVRAK